MAPSGPPSPDSDFDGPREAMVDAQLRARGIADERVLEAMRGVPRHEFVPQRVRELAYADRALPIGHGQTISQPYMVAGMLELLELRGDERVLEVGAGSGYQATLLGLLAARVDSVEIVESLAREARDNLERFGTGNVWIHVGDGSLGLPERAPFDAIVVAAGAPSIPPAYPSQLAVGGRLVIPVGPRSGQTLQRIRRTEGGFETDDLYGCAFVPLVGKHGFTGREADRVY